MRHYEIVFIVHPDQSEQVPAMIERYKGMVAARNGRIHRLEDWGRRQMAYPIQKMHKAHYVLMNVECDQETLDELEHAFRFNDAVLRHLTVNMRGPVTEASPMMRQEKRPASPDDRPRSFEDRRRARPKPGPGLSRTQRPLRARCSNQVRLGGTCVGARSSAPHAGRSPGPDLHRQARVDAGRRRRAQAGGIGDRGDGDGRGGAADERAAGGAERSASQGFLASRSRLSTPRRAAREPIRNRVEDIRSWHSEAAGSEASPRTSARKRPQLPPAVQAPQVLPLHGGRHQGDRLQGRRAAEGLHQRERQDHPGAHHRHQGRTTSASCRRPSSARASWRCCRTPTCTEEAGHASHPAGKARQPRPARRHRQGEGRLRPQLPDPARARPSAPPTANVAEFEQRRAELEKAQNEVADRGAGAPPRSSRD